MAKTKDKSFLERVESAIASMLPSNVSSYERMGSRPALDSGAKNLKGGSPATSPKALAQGKAGNMEVGRPNTSLTEFTRGAGGGGVAAALPRVGLLANPVTALLSTTTTANKGAEFKDPTLTADIAEMIASENAKRVQPAAQTAERKYREPEGGQRSPMDRQMTTPSPEPRYRESGGSQRSAMDRQMTTADEAPPKAVVVPEPKSGKLMAGDMTPEALFAVVHGGSFDPKSSTDKKKMAAISALREQEGAANMTPNKFALTIYRSTK